LKKKSKNEFNILSNIDKNIRKINVGFISSSKNSTILIKNLKKMNKDHKNSKSLEFEKQQYNEQYQMHQKNIKELLDSNEKIQYQIKDLEKRKAQIKEKLNSKEVESKIFVDKFKEEIKNYKSKIEKQEKNLMFISDTHKNLLKEKEIRIKNLILILNKLLIKYKMTKRKRGNSNASELLNNILFDKKTIDLNSDDINEKVIEEISDSIKP